MTTVGLLTEDGVPEGWNPPEPPTHHTEAETLEREFGPADEKGVYGGRS